jgi:predicted Zn finger-like uncharacterized protein
MPVRLSCPHCRAVLAVPDVHLGKSVRCHSCNGVFQAAPPAPPEAILDALPVEGASRAAPLLPPRSHPIRHVDEEDRSRVAWIVGGLVAGVLLLAVTGVLLWVVHANDDGAPPTQAKDDHPQGLDWFMLPQAPAAEVALAQPPAHEEGPPLLQPLPPDFLPVPPILPATAAASVGLVGDPLGQGPWLVAWSVVYERPLGLGLLPYVETRPRIPGQPGFPPGPPP